MLQKIRFYSSIGALYIFTIGTIGVSLYSSQFVSSQTWAKPQQTTVEPKVKKPVAPHVITGAPVRILLPESSIDLAILTGDYNESDGSWTLSDTNAHFATMSSPANNQGGTTFIYGHGTDAVFGKIGTHHPPLGSIAKIHTDNNHVFTYTLQDIRNFEPNDTSIFKDMKSGSPQLIIQTCTGMFSEWRTMFIFTYRESS